MSYAVGLGEGRPLPAGIIALSGFIPTVEGWARADDRRGLPGRASATARATRSSRSSSRATRATGSRRPAPTSTYHESPIGHTIDPRAIPLMAARVRARV